MEKFEIARDNGAALAFNGERIARYQATLILRMAAHILAK